MKRQKINAFIFYETLIGREDFKRIHPSPKYEFKEIEDDLDVFYQTINCTTIDIVVKKIGDKYYNIIVDDEGLFRDDPIITVADPNNINDALVGTVIIAGLADEDGDLTSLTKEDAENIRSHINYGFRECKTETPPRRRMVPIIFINTN